MRLSRVLVAVAAAAVVGACGNDGLVARPSATPSFDVAAAQSEIKANWRTFFDGKSPFQDRLALLQTSRQLSKALRKYEGNPVGERTQAIVRTVLVARGGTSATVTYDLLVSGRLFVQGGGGTAVLEGDTWKVSKATFCGIVSLVPPRDRTLPGCA